ncbi:uncharacterized protein EHS24_002244 [Apiotrichum porosum]|uniref:BRCT domain-containing protein n=1 Tax=Apiotrichum porosum TaxID=105984 RepID=A0A427XHY9_9TREE|nr:uncharacterized protein EHS24_002244 [Apiotrichum porosum]RSH78519.1 hypothetical protein EHS24_002244 [Apiotrichum porosum]
MTFIGDQDELANRCAAEGAVIAPLTEMVWFVVLPQPRGPYTGDPTLVPRLRWQIQNGAELVSFEWVLARLDTNDKPLAEDYAVTLPP